MPLAPCSSCTAGDHAACDAANRPYCGCRQGGHVAAPAEPAAPAPDEPTEVAMADVLDAATRAPKGEVATEQDAIAAEPGAVAPVVQDAAPVDPATVLGIDPAAQAAAVLASSGLADLGPSDDADESLDVTAPTGVVGLVDIDTPAAEPSTPVDAGAEPSTLTSADAGAPADTPAAEAPGVIIMAEPRSPRLHVSLWDGDRAHTDPTEDGATAAELAQTQVATENDAAFLAALQEAMDDDAHGYAGTPEAPYLCRCGKDAGSLGKLGSHLGIQSDPDAMSELGKLTVPNKLASSEQLPPADDTVKTSPGTGEPMVEVDTLTAPDGTPVVTSVEVLPPPLPPDVQALADLNAADLAAQGALTPLPGPSDDDEATTPEDQAVATAMTSLWGTEWDGTLPPHVRILIVNGAVGTVTDFSGGTTMHPALADEVLEHFGFDPTPLPEGVQAALVEATTAAVAAAPQEPAAAPPAPAQAPPALTVGAAMPARQVATPTQIQVARVTTNCAKGSDTIEEGQMIGHLDGYGWVHLACATAG